MQNTVCDGCTKKKCANKITTPWQNEKGEVTIVEDCAPKRTLMMMQQLHNAFIGVQKSQEELRNEIDAVKKEWKKTKDKLLPMSHVKRFYIDQDDSGQ